MRIDRFFIPFENTATTLTIADKPLLHQLKHVLRKKVGDAIVFVNEHACEADALISSLSEKEGVFILSGHRTVASESATPLTLCVAVLKRENTELVIQKATELGMSHIILLETKHTIKKGAPLPRLRLIAKEAAEQSGRGRIPSVEYMSFARACELFGHNAILLDPSGQALQKNTSVETIFIGPEGGWHTEELAHAQESGISIGSVGTRILRAETAAIVGSAWLSDLF